jgi:hypothetical protein
MMRKLLLAAISAAMVVSVVPQAHADVKKSGTFAVADHPACAATCSYWLDQTGDGTVASECSKPDALAAATGTPLPRKPWADADLVAPAGMNLAIFKISVTVDWDSFICEPANADYDGDGIKGGTLAVGALPAGEACNGVLGEGDPTGEGCDEQAQVPVVPGRHYIFRAYNWSDAADCPWSVTFKTVS